MGLEDKLSGESLRKKLNVGWFNLFAKFNLYQLTMQVFKGLKKLRGKVIEEMDLKPGQSILEVSLGEGDNLPAIYEKTKNKGVKVYGLDISEEMLKKCKAKAKNIGIDIKLKLGDAEKLSNYFDYNTFDRILFFHALSFYDSGKALSEAVKILKSDGYLVVADMGITKKTIISKKIINLLYCLSGFKMQKPVEAPEGTIDCSTEKKYVPFSLYYVKKFKKLQINVSS